jgi:hypothetical protein
VQRTWRGVGGKRTLVCAVWVALALGVALACVGTSAARTRASTVPAAASFVSAYPLSQATELDRYSLANGRSLGVLVHIPPLKSTAKYSTVSTPHLLANGDYMLTVSHGELCGSSRGKCHAVPNSCFSRVETVDPGSGTVEPLFSVTGAWRVSDAVPSPDGHSVALVEYSCSSYYNGPRLTVRDLTTGSSHVVTQDLSPCGLESDVTWNPSSTKLVFAYGTHLNLDNLPAGCELATAKAADTLTTPANWTTIRRRASCGFDSTAFDAIGIVAIVGCTDKYDGIYSTLLQYNSKSQVVFHRALDSFDPPQYSLETQLESDPLANTVLVSEIVTDDPDASDVWTFNGTTLRHVDNWFGDDILAEP